MAIVTPILLLLVFGIVDFGFLFQRYVVLTNAAVEGARVATMPGYTIGRRPGAGAGVRRQALPPGVVATAAVVRRTTCRPWRSTWPGMQVTVTHVYTLQYIAPIMQARRRTTAGDGHAHGALDHAEPGRP